ncbi:VMAP-C domain-containing protein [Kitasatospora purpeofusca]|uniref:VMAP-C domain-containing protein n=1 Tax=Kitasatospora purpeofusca TaxID=67352 RepID=UPI0035DC4B2A
MPELQEPGFRHLVLGETRHRLGAGSGFAVLDSPQVRDHLLNVVQACRGWHDPTRALRELSGVLGALRPATAAVEWLEAAVDAVTAAGLLACETQLVVLRSLRSLDPQPSPARVLYLVESVCEAGETHPVRLRDGLAGAVSRLNQVRLGEGTPLLLRFLSRLGATCGGTEAVRVTELVRRATRELGLPDQEPVRPLASSAASGDAGKSRPLVLQITLDDVSSVGSDAEPVYVFEAALYDTAEQPWRLVSKRAGREPLSRSVLERRGGRHLATWAELASAAADAEGLRVEFLLPWSLLGHPAELWPVDEDDYPVGMHFPVVVRSLDRMRSAFWHTAWKGKWRALEAAVDSCSPGTVADLSGWIVHPDGTAPIDAELAGRALHLGGAKGDVRRWLDSRPQTAFLVLSFPYAYHPKRPGMRHQAVKDAVREGVPVMLWRRDHEGSTAELHMLLGELSAAKLPELADHVQRRRRAASEDDRGDLGHHLSLLWDDPGHAAWLAPAPFRAPAAAPMSEGPTA